MSEAEAHLEALIIKASDATNNASAVAASKQIEEIAKTPGFLRTLVNIYKRHGDTVPGLLTSIYIKTHILHHWEVEPTGQDCLSPEDRTVIRNELIPLLLNSGVQPRAQLVHALGIVAEFDFPSKWENMLALLMPQQGESFHHLFIRFDAIHTVLYKYRDIAKTDENIETLRVITDNVLPILLGTFQYLHKEATTFFALAGQNNLPTNIQLTAENANIDIESFRTILQALSLSIEVFQDLTQLDISPLVEDNMGAWFLPMFELLQQVSYYIKPIGGGFGESIVDYLQGCIVDVLTLFSASYDEMFKPFIEQAVGVVWILLQNRDHSSRYDVIICACMKFVALIANREWYRGFFTAEKIQSIIDGVVAIHAPPREDDLDAAEYDESYIERELISNSNENISKRGAVIHLVSSLCRYYEEITVGFVSQQIMRFTDIYTKDNANWQSLETALLLLVTIGVQPESKAASIIDIAGYINNHVVPLLNQFAHKEPPSPILVTSALKVMVTYKKTIPEAAVVPFISLLADYVLSEQQVIASYSAYCVSSLVGFGGLIKEDIGQAADELIRRFLRGLDNHNENQYLLAAAITVIGAAPKHILTSAAEITQTMLGLLSEAVKKQSNQRYMYLLFELLAILLRIILGYSTVETRGSTLGQVEAYLLPIFKQLLSNEAFSDVHTYVINIMAMLLEEHQNTIPSEYHETIARALDSTEMWKISASIPSLTRLLVATLHNNVSTPDGQAILPLAQYENNMLGIYRLLLLSSKTAQYASQLGLALAAYTPIILKNLRLVLQMQFKRLTESRDQQYRLQFVYMYSFLIVNDLLQPAFETNHAALLQYQRHHFVDPFGIRLSSDDLTLQSIRNGSTSLINLIQAMNSIKDGIIRNVFNNVWTAALRNVTTNIDKKLIFRSTTMILGYLLSNQAASQNINYPDLMQQYIIVGMSLFDSEQNYIVQPSYVICADNAHAIESRSLITATKTHHVLRCAVSQQVPDPIQINSHIDLLKQIPTFHEYYNANWIKKPSQPQQQQPQQ